MPDTSVRFPSPSPAVLDDRAKSPEALALGLARYAASFYDGRPMMLSPKEMVEFHLENFPHMTLLESAGVEVDVLYPDIIGFETTSLWMCPLIAQNLSRLGSMSRKELKDIGDACRRRLPSLKTAVFADLAGDPTSDLGSVIRQWAARTLEAIADEEDLQTHERMRALLAEIHAESFHFGATNLEDLDLRLEDICALEGIQSPASIGTLLLRSTGLVDAETWKLGAPDNFEVLAGIPYALFLAALGNRAGISSAGASLQDAYEALVLGSLHGHANCLASGGIRSGDWERADAPRFVIHSPVTLHVVADALLHVLATLGPFEAICAASGLNSSDGTQTIDPDLARQRAEERFAKETLHGQDIIREALCSHLDEHLPSPYPGDDPGPEFDPAIAERVAARLTNALIRAHPGAEAITPEGRHSELCHRIEQSLLP